MTWLYQTAYSNRLYLVAAAVAFVVSLLLTPIVRRLAIRFGIVDHPDDQRKLHDRATPLAGGVAVLLAFFVSLTVVLIFSHSQKAELLADAAFVIGLGVSSVLLCAVGLIDDRFSLRGRQKLLGQIAAAGILLASGLWIDKVQVFGYDVTLGILAAPFTLFWLLGAINALNLIDGVDGLATSVGLVISVAIAVLAILTGHRTEAFLALAMAGALAAFLVYNIPPASIFLGDAGSMVIGLVLGALAIRGSLKGPATVALAAPAAMWAIPILDVGIAILRRKLTGRSIYTTDRGHLHHVLLRRGYGDRKTVAIIGVVCICTAAGAVVSVWQHNEYLALGAVTAVIGTLVITRLFGHHECILLLRRVKHFVLSFVQLRRHESNARQIETHLQGTRQWNELWTTLTEFAERFDLSEMQLNVSLPAMREEYHAQWKRTAQPDHSELWYSEIPLVGHDVTVGRLRIGGTCDNGSVCTWMGDLITGLKPFETQMLDLLVEETPELADTVRPIAADTDLQVEGLLGQDEARAEPQLNEMRVR